MGGPGSNMDQIVQLAAYASAEDVIKCIRKYPATFTQDRLNKLVGSNGSIYTTTFSSAVLSDNLEVAYSLLGIGVGVQDAVNLVHDALSVISKEAGQFCFGISKLHELGYAPEVMPEILRSPEITSLITRDMIPNREE